jgi:virginiamycin B lyase
MKQNTIVRFDPATEKFQTWLIPSGGGVIRNMMPDKDGNVWIAGSGVKTIGEVQVMSKK